MKKLFLLIVAAIVSVSVKAQDAIYLIAGDSIDAKVLTVNNSEVSYKLTGYEDGPLFTLKTDDIVAIHYANGMYQYFADTPSKQTQEQTTPRATDKQDKKGHFFIGGTTEIGYSGVFNFALEPVIGYEINDWVAIGTGIGPVVAAGNGASAIMGIVEPFVRICAWHNDIVFIDFKVSAGVGFKNELELCQLGVRPSLRVRLTEHCEMAADLGLFGAQYTYSGGWDPVFGIGATAAGLWFTYRF